MGMICGICEAKIKGTEEKHSLKDGFICGDCKEIFGFADAYLLDSTLEEVRKKVVENLENEDDNIEIDLFEYKEDKITNPRSAIEMFEMSENKGYNLAPEKKALKHFGIIESILLPSETVLVAFMAFTEGNKGLDALANVQAIAVTDKRIITGCSRPLSQGSETIDISSINNISLERGVALSGKITVSTLMGDTVFPLTSVHAPQIHADLNRILYELKNNSVPISTPQPAPQVPSEADEIRKYKSLLDDGILTQEEFDAKKKELLGL